MKKILAMLLALMLLVGVGAVAEEAAGSGWRNILLLGGDARNMEKYERTDCVMILSLNAETQEAKMTSIMRDTWVKIPGHGSNKINAANYFEGPELAVQTVNENFGLDIEDYILINMADMQEIVDLFGGVDIDVTAAEKKVANGYIRDAERDFYNERDDYFDYSPIADTGVVHLDGVQAMAYCRDRYNNSDFDRVMRQQEVLLALAAKAQALEAGEAVGIAGRIGGFVSTSLTVEEVLELAGAVLAIDPAAVGQYRIPAEGDYKSGTFDGTWMIRPDLEKCRATLAEYIYG